MEFFAINLNRAANADDVAAAIALETPDTHEQPKAEQVSKDMVVLTSQTSPCTCVGIGNIKQTVILTYSNQRIVSMSYALNVEVDG